jgi:hypothetical protein
MVIFVNLNGGNIMKALSVVIILALMAVSVYAGERLNNYKTHKVTSSTVMVSCNDEREPLVKKLDGPFVLITCTEGK